MILWIVLTVLVAVTVAILTVPLVRRYDARPSGSAAMLSVLADQLADIDTQQRAGTISAPEADALRIETKRRLLVETVAERPARALGSGALGQIAVAVAVLVTLGGTLLYSRLGSPETPIAPGEVAVVAEFEHRPGPRRGGTRRSRRTADDRRDRSQAEDQPRRSRRLAPARCGALFARTVRRGWRRLWARRRRLLRRAAISSRRSAKH